MFIRTGYDLGPVCQDGGSGQEKQHVLLVGTNTGLVWVIIALAQFLAHLTLHQFRSFLLHYFLQHRTHITNYFSLKVKPP